MTTGALAILRERERQIAQEGWTAEHDDEHASGELAGAAGCYVAHILYSEFGTKGKRAASAFITAAWPFSFDWWKPKTHREDLVRAGALIAAEIDRLDRMAEREKGGTP